MRYLLIFSVIIFQSMISDAYGVNVGFMPGDAFFAARMTRESVDAFAKDNSDKCILKFAPPPEYVPSLCAFAGFFQLEITDVPAQWRKDWFHIYSEVRTEYPRRVEQFSFRDDDKINEYEINGLWVFVYNRDFDLKGFQIGLKYNETWPNPLPDFKETFRLHACKVYDPYFSDKESIIGDWKHGVLVKPLMVQQPRLDAREPAIIGSQIKDPVSISAKDIQVVICPADDLNHVLHIKDKKKEEEDETDVDLDKNRVDLIVLDSDGTWKLRWKHKVGFQRQLVKDGDAIFNYDDLVDESP